MNTFGIKSKFIIGILIVMIIGLLFKVNENWFLGTLLYIIYLTLLIFLPLIFFISIVVLGIGVFNAHKNPYQKKHFKVAVILTFLIPIFYASLFVISIMQFGSCNDMFDPKIYSPNNKYYAEVHVNSCGGAAGSLTMNIFLNENGGKDSKSILSLSHIDNIKPVWINNNTLKIRYTKCWAAQNEITSWENIKIIYDKNCEEDPTKNN